MSEKDEWQKLIDARKVAEYWMNRYIQAEDRLEQYEWVSVKDRLPPEYKLVLCLLEDGDYTVGYLIDADENLWNNQLFGTVAYWMPLPELPKEDAE